MELERVVQQLAAAAEPSRLRLLVALLGGETSVGDLVTVLAQSQPRVSRHLRVLAEAGLVESFREGRSIFYRWSSEGLAAGIASSVATVADSDDPMIRRDGERLLAGARQREREALRRALRAGRASHLHGMAGDRALADLLRAMLADQPLGAILHVGCGSGQILGLLLTDARSAVGTEPSGALRQLARVRLRPARLPRWTIREARPHALPFAVGAFDVVILEDALGDARETSGQSGLAEAARVLGPAGRLLLLDRILPTDGHAAARLAALGFAVTRRQWLPGRAPDRGVFLASRSTTIHARTGTDD